MDSIDVTHSCWLHFAWNFCRIYAVAALSLLEASASRANRSLGLTEGHTVKYIVRFRIARSKHRFCLSDWSNILFLSFFVNMPLNHFQTFSSLLAEWRVSLWRNPLSSSKVVLQSCNDLRMLFNNVSILVNHRFMGSTYHLGLYY